MKISNRSAPHEASCHLVSFKNAILRSDFLLNGTRRVSATREGGIQLRFHHCSQRKLFTISDCLVCYFAAADRAIEKSFVIGPITNP